MVKSVEHQQNGTPSAHDETRSYGALNENSPSTNGVNEAHEGPNPLKKPSGIKWPTSRGKAAFVILMLTLLNAANKLDRYVLIEVVKEMATDLEFGDRSCINSTAFNDHATDVEERKNYACPPDRCDEHDAVALNDTASNITACHWEYWGTGLEYQLLAGPAFIVAVGLMRVPLTFAMEHGRINGRNIVVACAVAWSMATMMTGFATKVWHVVLCRVLLGLFQAPFSPFSVALVTAYFPPQLRGIAMSILNSGIAFGYALAYVLGFIKELAGWRWTYWAASIPGVIVAIIMLFTLPNPDKLIQKQTSQSLGKMRRRELLIFLNWATIVPLCLGSAFRFGATYIFNYNINNYLLHYYPHFHVHNYLSWTPILSGFAGIFFGGVLSDMARRRYGVEGRMFAQIALSVICAPIVTLIFFLEPPDVFFAVAIGTAMADAWTGGTVSILSELIPSALRPSFFAVFYCLINIVGGTLNITLPALRRALGFRYAMIMAVVGLISLGTVLFTLGFFAMMCSRRKKFVDSNEIESEEDENENSTTAPLYT